jgi:hypothetical protein
MAPDGFRRQGLPPYRYGGYKGCYFETHGRQGDGARWVSAVEPLPPYSCSTG